MYVSSSQVKLRVRTLEVERMLERIELRQRMAGAGIGAALAWQMSRSVAGVLWQQVAFLAVAARRRLRDVRSSEGRHDQSQPG